MGRRTNSRRSRRTERRSPVLWHVFQAAGADNSSPELACKIHAESQIHFFVLLSVSNLWFSFQSKEGAIVEALRGSLRRFAQSYRASVLNISAEMTNQAGRVSLLSLPRRIQCLKQQVSRSKHATLVFYLPNSALESTFQVVRRSFCCMKIYKIDISDIIKL